MRPTVRRSAPVLNSMIARRRTRRVLVDPGRQQQPQRHPLEDEQHDQEFEQREEQQQRQQLAHASARPTSPRAGRTSRSSCCGQAAKKASTSEQHQHRLVQPDVVIGVRLVGGDGDDLAVALRLRRGDRGADLGMILGAQVSASPSPRSAAAAERSAAAGEAAAAAAAASRRRRPSRRRRAQPRLSASRPHRMTATSPLSSPPRRRLPR